MEQLELFEKLKTKLGEDVALELLQLRNEQKPFDLKNFATKEDLKQFATKEDLWQLKIEMITAISKSKTETIKWMFIFWAGQLVITLGVVFLFIKH